MNNRLQEFKYDLNSLKLLKDQKEKLLLKKRDELNNLSDKVNILTQAQDLLRVLLQKCLTQEVKPVEDFCTYGLKQVFYDLDLGFKISHKETSSDVKFEFRITEKGRDLPVEDSTGGSILEVASFMLRIMLIMRLNKARLIFLDEFFTGVGKEYRPTLMKLIKVLSNRFQFTIVFITHVPDFIADADKVFHVYTGNNSLQVKEE